MNDPRLRRHPIGFLEVAAKPSKQELAAYYAEVYYQQEKSAFRKSYSPEELDAIKLRVEQRAEHVMGLRGTRSPGRLLDVGCGEGFALAAFAEMGWQVEGIDYSRAGVEAMNPAMADRVEQGDFFSLLDLRNARGDRYDLVWLGNVLEHALDPVGLLGSLRRLVMPDGILVVTVPNDGNAYHETLVAAGMIPDRFWIAIPDHLSYFTADSLRRIAQETGWSCLDILGDFPIDWFLSHQGSNYVADRTQGAAAHRARLMLERMIGMAGAEAANHFYSALAKVGAGRNISAFLRPRADEQTA